jgi:hypothetical protein
VVVAASHPFPFLHFGRPLPSMPEPARELPELVMVDKLRTRLAKFIVQHFNRPHSVVIRAWLWLAAEADNAREKRAVSSQS